MALPPTTIDTSLEYMTKESNVSPTTVDAPLDYHTVDSYTWPKQQRAKRFRQEAEVRKQRHRENQRRFMVRKQARITVMRREVELMELQLKYLQALQEEQALLTERQGLDQSVPNRPSNRPSNPPDVNVKSDPLAGLASDEASALDTILQLNLETLHDDEVVCKERQEPDDSTSDDQSSESDSASDLPDPLDVPASGEAIELDGLLSEILFAL